MGGTKGIKGIEEKVRCQITKYQMCMGCLGCEGVCKYNAIRITEHKDGSYSYQINDDKCIRCTSCISHYNGGCYIRKVLAIKR